MNKERSVSVSFLHITTRHQSSDHDEIILETKSAGFLDIPSYLIKDLEQQKYHTQDSVTATAATDL